MNNLDPDILYYLVIIKPPLTKKKVKRRFLTLGECCELLLKYNLQDYEPKKIHKNNPDRIHLIYNGLGIHPQSDCKGYHDGLNRMYRRNKLKIGIINILKCVFGIDAPPGELIRLLNMERFERECAILSYKIKHFEKHPEISDALGRMP